MIKEDCRHDLREHTATAARPYHFVDSGLPNIYLIGVRYRSCRKCGARAADIPAPVELMNVIAESIVMRPGVLSGPEIRFLRKRVGKKAAEFAGLINNTPQHLSKLETGALPLQEATDKLIRLTYGVLSGDHAVLQRITAQVEEWFRSIHGRKIRPIRIRSRNHRWIAA